jgi:hypothetical protein
VDVKYAAIAVLTQFSQGNLLHTFTVLFRHYLEDNIAYLTAIDEAIVPLCELKPSKEELLSTGIVDFWVEFTLKETEGEGKKPADGRLAAIGLLCTLWARFPAKIEEKEETAEAILTAIKRSLREKSLLMRVFLT